MANDEDVARLQKGVALWNEWRAQDPFCCADFSQADLAAKEFAGANLAGANFAGANLAGANFAGANLVEASFFMANVVRADLGSADLSRANLYKANLCEANLSRTILRSAVLAGADIRLANLTEANLTNAKLRRTDLRAANLRAVELRGADLSEANLEGALLQNTSLVEANFLRANLETANLEGARLRGVNLAEAIFRGASLREADLSGAILWGASLEWTNLRWTNLWRANLGEANLSRAILEETVFADVDLSETKGLDACRHGGPSILDHRTLQQSGRLPLNFMRGCGLPDRLIDYLPSLLDEAIQYYSCFISYSSKDEAFAKRLHADLQNNGVRCWFAPHDLPIGAKTWDAIDSAIRVRDKLLLILSKNAIASDWVENEVSKAFAEERRRKQVVLFPVRIDQTVMNTEEPWAAMLRDQRNIGDFRRWKDHDAYQQALERVLRDLKQAPSRL